MRVRNEVPASRKGPLAPPPVVGDAPDLALCSVLPTDKRHRDCVSILPIDQDSVALNALSDKPRLLVESDSPRIVDMHGQFDADKASVARPIQSRLEKPRPETIAAIGRHNPQAEGSSMSVRGKVMPANVAPPDDFAFRHGDEMWVALFDGVQHEFADMRQWRRFEKGEIFPLARDRVERAMKALNVFGAIGAIAASGTACIRSGAVMRSIMTKTAKGAYGRVLGFRPAPPFFEANSLLSTPGPCLSFSRRHRKSRPVGCAPR